MHPRLNYLAALARECRPWHWKYLGVLGCLAVLAATGRWLHIPALLQGVIALALVTMTLLALIIVDAIRFRLDFGPR